MGFSLMRKLKDNFLTRGVRDVFDANTADDFKRRAQAQVNNNQPVVRQTYQQQQIAQGNKRPYQNFGSAIIGNTARFLNTGEQAKQELLDTARLYGAQIRGDKEDLRSTNQRIKERQQQAYQPNSGFLGAGTIFNSPKEFNTLGAKELTKRVGATTLGTAGEVLPVGKGMTLANQGVKVLPKLAAFGAVTNAAANTGEQYISTGRVDPRQVAMSAGIGAGLGVAAPVVGAGVKKVVQTPLNDIGAVGKNIKKPKVTSKLDPLESLKQEARTYRGTANDLTPERIAFLKKKGYTSFVDETGNQVGVKTDKPGGYGMSHRPTKNGATADDITKNGVIPKDVYTNPEYYGQMDLPTYKESFSALQNVKGKPDATVTIYRASPKNELNDGDWVTLSKSYAKQESLAENSPVQSFKVKAKDIQFAGDDLNEFGYFPQSQPPKSPLTVEKPKVTLKTPEQIKVAQKETLESIVKPKVELKTNVVKPTIAPKSRGFESNILKTLPDNLTAKQVAEAMPGYKPITNKRTLTKAANAIVDNPEAEFARVIMKPQLTSADDIATGNLLLREAIEKGDTESAIQLGAKLGIDGTKLGQAVQAYATFKKTTPEGVVTYATKQAGKAGKQLTPEVAGQLIEKAKAISQMADGIDKARATRELLGQADSLGRTWKDTLQQVLSAPRAAMATADLSAPLRQGAVLGTRYPKQFGRAFVDSVKYFANPKLYEQEMYNITQRPTFSLMRNSKLAVSAAEQLTGTEEQFMSNLLEGKTAKRLGVGQLVAASDRAYSGFLTKFRADVFDKVVNDYSASGIRLSPKTTKSLAKFINSASGRGSGTNLDKYGGLLSQALFSPKLWKSRIDTLNPVYYARLDPVARKLALQSAATFAGTATLILSLAKASGASVEDDPRSADFGKIKVGDTRYDILGGHQQNIRLAAQLITGEKINSVTGEVQTLGPDRGFGKPSRLDLAYQFLENKENPIIAYGTKALRGTDPVGNKVNLATEAAKMAIPLNLQSTYETAKNVGSIPKGVAMNVPGTFGIGVQTYGQEKAPPKQAGQLPVKPNTNDLSKPDYISPIEAKREKYSTKLNKSLSSESRNTLVKYNSLSSFGKAKFNANPDNEIALAMAQLEEGLLSNSLTAKQQKTLEKKIFGNSASSSSSRKGGRSNGGSGKKNPTAAYTKVPQAQALQKVSLKSSTPEIRTKKSVKRRAKPKLQLKKSNV